MSQWAAKVYLKTELYKQIMLWSHFSSLTHCLCEVVLVTHTRGCPVHDSSFFFLQRGKLIQRHKRSFTFLSVQVTTHVWTLPFKQTQRWWWFIFSMSIWKIKWHFKSFIAVGQTKFSDRETHPQKLLEFHKLRRAQLVSGIQEAFAFHFSLTCS